MIEWLNGLKVKGQMVWTSFIWWCNSLMSTSSTRERSLQQNITFSCCTSIFSLLLLFDCPSLSIDHGDTFPMFMKSVIYFCAVLKSPECLKCLKEFLRLFLSRLHDSFQFFRFFRSVKVHPMARLLADKIRGK